MGRLLIVIGLSIAALGMLITIGIPFFRLPGDIVVRRGNFSFYLPLATSLLLSVLLTILFAFFRR